MFRYIYLIFILAFASQLSFAETENPELDKDTQVRANYESFIAVRSDYKVECPHPIYPSASVRNGEQGTTEIKIDVAINGKVTSAQVVTSSKWARLDAAAIEQYKQCVFQPKAPENRRPFTVRLPVTWKVVR